jgi:hypothetical protein
VSSSTSFGTASVARAAVDFGRGRQRSLSSSQAWIRRQHDDPLPATKRPLGYEPNETHDPVNVHRLCQPELPA